MKIPGITWVGGKVDDEEMLGQLPHRLVNILNDTNGFILYHGALHVRGASVTRVALDPRSTARGVFFHKLSGMMRARRESAAFSFHGRSKGELISEMINQTWTVCTT